MTDPVIRGPPSTRYKEGKRKGKKVAAEAKTSQRLTTGSAGFPILRRMSTQAQLPRRQHPFFSS